MRPNRPAGPLGVWGLRAVGAAVIACAAAAGTAAYAFSTGGSPPPPRANPRAPARILLAGGQAPSPFITKYGGTYYLYSSSWGFSPNLPVRTSQDLRSWSRPTETFPRLPPWALPGLTWDPAVYKLDGRYVLYYSDALSAQPQTKCIGVATSPHPLGPFRGTTQPFVCQLDRHGSIDPRVFVDTHGDPWLVWKSDDNADVSGSEHTTIYSQRLTADGLRLFGPQHEILDASQPWEGRIVESPQMVSADGHDWLFFSANWFNQPVYGIGVARCAGPAGPCANPSRPLISSNSQGTGPGEESVLVDGDVTWIAYTPFHFYKGANAPVALARVAFGSRGPYLAKP